MASRLYASALARRLYSLCSRAPEADPLSLAAALRLKERQTETRACARTSDRLAVENKPPPAHALARLAAVNAALAVLEEMIWRKDPDVKSLIVSGRNAAGAGFGAAECARARLYHPAQVSDNGRLQVYAHVAPTKWKFHPAGPLAAQLLVRAEVVRIAASRRK